METLDGQVRIGADVLADFIQAAFEAVGMSRDDARMAATALVRTEARGIVTHGVRHVPRYVRAMRAGGVNATARFDVVRESPTTATIEANAGLGHVVATKAINLAIEKARSAGVAVVLVRNSSHLGAPGHYALLAAEAGMIAMVYSTTPRVMKAPGSRNAVVGSSPIGYAVPGDAAPFVLDMAMSVVAGNKINLAQTRSEPLPEGWIVGPDGAPSTDPDDYRNGGALLPIAGHKGFGLAVFGELLAGALAGLDWDEQPQLKTHQPGSTYFADLRPDDQWNSGHAFVVIDVGAFLEPALLRRRADRLREVIKQAAPETGTPGVRMPGERAAAAEARSAEEGIPLTAETWSSLRDLAGELAIDAPPLRDDVISHH